MRDLCECQAELGGIARIVEVSFMSSFKFVRYGGGEPYGICLNVKLNYGDILQRSVRQMCYFLLCG